MPVRSRSWLLGLGAAGMLLLATAAGPAVAASSARSTTHQSAARHGDGDADADDAGLAARTNAPLPIGSTTLARGDQGPAVAVLQGDLMQLGYPIGRATGYFGPVTQTALRTFQRRHGLAATGVLNAATLHAIERAMGIGVTSPAPRPSAGTSGKSGSASQGGGAAASGKSSASSQSGAAAGGLHVGGTIDGYTIKAKINLVATAYGPSLKDNYPFGPVDAFGKPLVPGDVAVDPRLIPLNTHLYVTGYKSPYLPKGGELAVARDTGGAIKGHRIDMFINGNPQEVSAFGIQHVVAYILGH